VKQHLFTTGETLYGKNIKKMEEGEFAAETIYYDEVNENTKYEVKGHIGGNPVLIKFTVSCHSMDDLKFKAMVKILMQTDLLLADWESYEIIYI
jgi:hypothetical protein